MHERMKDATERPALGLKERADEEGMGWETESPHLAGFVPGHELEARTGEDRFKGWSQAIIAVELLHRFFAAQQLPETEPGNCQHFGSRPPGQVQ